MDSIPPGRLLTLVRPGNDLVLRRIRNLKRCVQACGCNITTPRYAPQFGSRLHFKRCQALPKETLFCISDSPLSAALANGADTLSITADCYSVAAADAALAAGPTTPRRTISAALLAYYTSAQVDALPDQDVFTTNKITSALVAYRSAADQDTATASSIAAALLSYYTIAQVDGLLAGKLGVTEAASALEI